ncbi:MAG: prepilin-type N-terminal cleavage/methylation domain-containing protein [Phycisphaerales bacterium]|nr:prepilin-type N-terminal cleavage/methylation domain-containing protein [Phycisphaerales bacterium]
MSRRRRTSRTSAFTLIEVLVAVTIAAGVAGAVTIAISRAADARDAARSHQQAHSRADVAAERIAMDLSASLRDGDLYFARVAVLDASAKDKARDVLLLYAKSLRDSVRDADEAPEGCEYEVQYRLEASVTPPSQPRGAVRDAWGSRPRPATLWRRVDPVPDEMPEGGGVAYPLVDSVTSLSVEAFDGDRWYDIWDTDFDGYPHAVRVIVEAVSDDGRQSATARRVVAMDRVPLPYAGVEEVSIEAEPGAVDGGGG